MERIDYPVSLSYRSHWSMWPAIREFVQNAMDAGKPEAVDIKRTDEGLMIHDQGGGLKPKHLLFGVSDKDDDDRGTFGEGMKLAMLVCEREDYSVLVEGEDMMAMSGTHEIDGEVCLSVEYQDLPGDCNDGTKVIIDGYDGPTYEDRFRNTGSGDDKTIEEDRNGNELLGDDEQGNIYVDDIFVEEKDNLAFGYNLKDVDLEESRSMADESDVKKQIKNVWRAVTDPETWKNLLERLENSYEETISWYSFNLRSDSRDALKKAFVDFYGNDAVMRTDEKWETEARWHGANIITLDTFKEFDSFLPTDQSFVLDQQAKDREFIKWSRLTQNEQKILRSVRYYLKKINEEYGESIDAHVAVLPDSTAGECENKTIYIDRDQMKSREDALGVMIHEATHAVFGADDLTDHFIRKQEELAGFLVVN